MKNEIIIDVQIVFISGILLGRSLSFWWLRLSVWLCLELVWHSFRFWYCLLFQQEILVFTLVLLPLLLRVVCWIWHSTTFLQEFDASDRCKSYFYCRHLWQNSLHHWLFHRIYWNSRKIDLCCWWFGNCLIEGWLFRSFGLKLFEREVLRSQNRNFCYFRLYFLNFRHSLWGQAWFIACFEFSEEHYYWKSQSQTIQIHYCCLLEVYFASRLQQNQRKDRFKLSCIYFSLTWSTFQNLYLPLTLRNPGYLFWAHIYWQSQELWKFSARVLQCYEQSQSQYWEY